MYMHQLMQERVALFLLAIIVLKPFGQQDDRTQGASDQRAAAEKAHADINLPTKAKIVAQRLGLGPD